MSKREKKLSQKLLSFLTEIEEWQYEDGPEPDWKRAVWYRNELQDFADEDALPQQVQTMVWETVREWYKSYFDRKEWDRNAPEPQVFPGALREYFGQARMPKGWDRLTPEKQRKMVRKALDKLTKEGKLRTSVGGYRGRDTTMWDVPWEKLDEA